MHFPNTLILILNWNGKKDTIECLDSLKLARKSPAFSTLVVDNGSQDGSVDAIRAAHPDIPILETHQNLGFAGGNNAGLRWALEKSFKWILLLNNDTIADPDLLYELNMAAKTTPTGKIFGAKSYRYDDPTKFDHLGGMWDPSIAEFVGCKESNEKQQVDYVSGCALFMHRSVIETIGLLEEDFFLLWEESDFCARAKKAGFEIWTAPKARLWHKVSASFVGGKAHMQYFWWRNRLLWIQRNCDKKEKRLLYRRVIFPEMAKWIKLSALKTAQAMLLALIGKSCTERIQKARRYRAGVNGIWHFLISRFGNCPTKYLTRGRAHS